MKRPHSIRSRHKRQPIPADRVLLDQLHVEIYAPRRLSTAKARRIRSAVEHVLRSAAPLIEYVVQTSARTKPGEVVVRIGDGSGT